MVFGDRCPSGFCLGLAKRPKQTRRKTPDAKLRIAYTPFAWLAHAMEARAVELGLSITDLEDRTGFPRSRVHKTLQRQRRVDALEWLAWADALEIKDPIEFLREVLSRSKSGLPPQRLRRSTSPNPKPRPKP